MNKIEIFNQTNEQIIELEDVKRVIDIAIDNQKLDNLEFNIIIVDIKKHLSTLLNIYVL